MGFAIRGGGDVVYGQFKDKDNGQLRMIVWDGDVKEGTYKDGHCDSRSY